ncbi:protein sprouty homolog 2 [Gouania willdenowi]|uniref:Protein sprouty homolog 2 n=1 Tax=Gouania willdenowi TaxID=441366 RepID=A0A8C5D8F2_GOUWI|nr:protein sprouty homolog 2-like [Gouania willdenowi]
MDTRSQSDSDGEGLGGPPSVTRYDEVSRTDPRSSVGELHVVQVLSLDRIRITGSCNDYTDGPTVAPRSPGEEHRQQKEEDLILSSGEQQEIQELGNRKEDVDEIIGSDGTSVGGTCLGQKLLSSEDIIITQPKGSEELKPLTLQSSEVPPRSRMSKNQGTHPDKCEDCGRCRCTECRRSRSLPSCWLCGRQCMYSAQKAVEYGTCVCCVKGLLYHCSNDDEETCSDKPFSCTQTHCCVRWTAVSLFALLFPCLLCYLPAKGCITACQSCYNRVTRPGCRCNDAHLDPIHCEDVAKSK